MDEQERSLRWTRESLRDTTGMMPKAFSAYSVSYNFGVLNTMAEQGRGEFSYG
ncbi:MAG: hypothetical protein ACI9JP_000001, partial [Granulosicoccus sp.]